jgi:hypothetical protein
VGSSGMAVDDLVSLGNSFLQWGEGASAFWSGKDIACFGDTYFASCTPRSCGSGFGASLGGAAFADIELDFHVSTWEYSEIKAIVVKYVNVVT